MGARARKSLQGKHIWIEEHERMNNARKREKDRAIKKERETDLNRFYFCGN